MPLFSYQAIPLHGGKRQRGVQEAESKAQLVRALRQQGLVPVDIVVTQGEQAQRQRQRIRLKPQDQLEIARGLANLLGAGIPADQALGMLLDLAETDSQQAALIDWRDGLRDGKSLSEAIEQGDAAVSGFFVSMIRAGEAGGSLDTALNRLADYQERAKALRDSVISALIYPAILLGVAVISVVILLTFVVPQFKDLFDDMGAALPLPTQIVVAAGDFLLHWWWLLSIAIVAGVWLFRRALARPAFRERFDRRLLGVPLLGSLLLRLDISRFAYTLGTLLQNGVPLLEGMGIVANTVGNLAIRREINDASAQLREGGRLAAALGKSHFTRLALQLIRIGEETGKLEPMLDQIGGIYDQEVQSQVKRMLALLEPALILGLGVLIAGIIMSILVAILAVNDLAM